MSILARLRSAFAAGLNLISRGSHEPRRYICRVTRDGGKTWTYWPGKGYGS